jgi:putative RecB family exonuclease
MRALSHSSINLYLDCPKKWHFKYVEKIPEKPRHFFSFGKTVHDALEFLYGGKTLPPPSLEEVLKRYEEEWIAEGYKDAQQEEDYKAQGRRILEEYYAKHIDAFRLPYFVEYGFHLKVDGVPVRGFVDRIDKIGDNALEIIDYKTGKAIPKSRVERDAQLTMYQMACEELLGLKVEKLTFYHLPSQTPLTSERRAQDAVKELRERIVTTAKLIQDERFDPKPEERKCDWCDFKPLCPVFKHLYATTEAPEAAPAVKSDAKLSKLVDRYGKLKEDLKEREAKVEELRDEIVAALKEMNYVRAFGKQYEATVHRDDHWDFSKENKPKVLDEIKAAGFWDSVIGPLAPKVQKLMKDPNLPLQLRDRLQRLGRLREQATLRIKRVAEEE